MDEFLKRLSDYFTSAELVELLGIPVEDVIEDYALEIWDAQADLEEIMLHGK